MLAKTFETMNFRAKSRGHGPFRSFSDSDVRMGTDARVGGQGSRTLFDNLSTTYGSLGSGSENAIHKDEWFARKNGELTRSEIRIL